LIVAEFRLENGPVPAHIGAMEYQIQIRHRSPLPTPWKWEIFGDRLITSGHQSYASRSEAYEAGQAALAGIVASDPGAAE
jgi:hypothetical protein